MGRSSWRLTGHISLASIFSPYANACHGYRDCRSGFQARQPRPLRHHHRRGRPAAVFGDQTVTSAMIDRIVHDADVLSLNGASYRLKSHQPVADTA
ncbi:ATP-binding protein [Cryobacterium sp. TMT1-66-1]|uniref:ATP-binding protein n=1 Tax=Cryobacterium sp. TMT1-66-1 TaxID=1259242 RepID=UPI00106C818F|nr:hypothetical protein E3T29_10630 [Cryobacterium sp. TMT1-66-1]